MFLDLIVMKERRWWCLWLMKEKVVDIMLLKCLNSEELTVYVLLYVLEYVIIYFCQRQQLVALYVLSHFIIYWLTMLVFIYVFKHRIIDDLNGLIFLYVLKYDIIDVYGISFGFGCGLLYEMVFNLCKRYLIIGMICIFFFVHVLMYLLHPFLF